MTTEESNRLILDFMNVTPRDVGGRWSWSDGVFYTVVLFDREDVLKSMAEYAKYNTSWDWLMPVVEKIEKLSFKWPGREEEISVDVHIYYDSCSMMADDKDEVLFSCYGVDGVGKLESTYKAVVEFITWFNNQKL